MLSDLGVSYRSLPLQSIGSPPLHLSVPHSTINSNSYSTGGPPIGGGTVAAAAAATGADTTQSRPARLYREANGSASSGGRATNPLPLHPANVELAGAEQNKSVFPRLVNNLTAGSETVEGGPLGRPPLSEKVMPENCAPVAQPAFVMATESEAAAGPIDDRAYIGVTRSDVDTINSLRATAALTIVPGQQLPESMYPIGTSFAEVQVSGKSVPLGYFPTAREAARYDCQTVFTYIHTYMHTYIHIYIHRDTDEWLLNG